MDGEYDRLVPDYEEYRKRELPKSEEASQSDDDLADDEA
jgi:hypothetical protein